jgi:hypothetical protein
MTPRRPTRWTKDKPSNQDCDACAYDAQLGLNLWDHPGNRRRPNYPSYNAGDAKKHEEGEQKLQCAVPFVQRRPTPSREAEQSRPS